MDTTESYTVSLSSLSHILCANLSFSLRSASASIETIIASANAKVQTPLLLDAKAAFNEFYAAIGQVYILHQEVGQQIHSIAAMKSKLDEEISKI